MKNIYIAFIFFIRIHRVTELMNIQIQLQKPFCPRPLFLINLHSCKIHRKNTSYCAPKRLLPITQRIIGDTVSTTRSAENVSRPSSTRCAGIKACRACSVWRTAFDRGIIQILSKKCDGRGKRFESRQCFVGRGNYRCNKRIYETLLHNFRNIFLIKTPLSASNPILCKT